MGLELREGGGWGCRGVAWRAVFPAEETNGGNMKWKNLLYGQSRAGGKGSSNSRLPGLV